MPGGAYQSWQLTLRSPGEDMGLCVAYAFDKPISLRDAIPLIEKYLANRAAEEPIFEQACQRGEEQGDPNLPKMLEGLAGRKERLVQVAQGLDELKRMLGEEESH